MRPKTGYLLLSVVGTMVPLSAFVPWVQMHGLDARLMVPQLFANRISAFFALDVIVSAVVVIVWALIERARRPRPYWWVPILATLAVGVSCGLPLMLYLGESDRAATRVAAM